MDSILRVENDHILNGRGNPHLDNMLYGNADALTASLK